MSLGWSIVLFWTAYVVISLVGVGHTFFNWKVLGIGAGAESRPAVRMLDVEAYARTVPYHPVYNLVLWPIVAFIYLVHAAPTHLWSAALMLAVAWTGAAIVVDFVGWVLARHPWRMTLKEMYMDYQPWITLIYLAIFASPFIASAIYVLK